MNKINTLKGFLESINTLHESQIEGILEAATILFEAGDQEADNNKSFTPKKTPGIDKLIAALSEKVKQEGDEKLAKLLAVASKEKQQLIAEAEEGKLWAKDAHPDEGKMHRMLDIPKGKKVTEVYTSGKSLAKDLLKANKGDKRKTAGMLGFVANVNKGTSVFDKALKALADLKGNKD